MINLYSFLIILMILSVVCIMAFGISGFISWIVETEDVKECWMCEDCNGHKECQKCLEKCDDDLREYQKDLRYSM